MGLVRVLFVADSHLGFDLPVCPRVQRRRRGHDFQANYERALEPALEGRVDVVIHGGDVFHRSRVPASVAYKAFEPLVRVADRGVPVFVVPGNHERSRIPHARFASHRRIHVFDRPRTIAVEAAGLRIAVSGFPYERRNIRTRFRSVLEATGWRRTPADARLLCIHHCVEGATVGPGDFMFRTAPDVIRCADLPATFAAVLSGHIHRHQVLEKDLSGRALRTPVLYPGSVERTSVAEKDEPKGYMTLEVADARVDASRDEPGAAGRLIGWRFHSLPARPMVVHEVGSGRAAGSVRSGIRDLLGSAPPDAVVRIRVSGALPEGDRRWLTAARLRALAPPTMNIDLRIGNDMTRSRRPVRAPGPSVLELPL